jgi:hypothetical protein
MPIAPSTKVSHYEVLSLLGAGGMGEVFRARDQRLGREVAIKVIKAEQSKEAVARFGQEARAAGGLNHPGIVAVFDIGEHEGQAYVVTELLEGETLRKKLASGPLSARKTAVLGAQVARALAAAHARGVIHRDIKPENLFVSNDGNVKILDFGLAKLRERDKDPQTETMSLTGPGVLLGTGPYMPPEHARGQVVDERGDIFSFGVTLYEMAGGRRPFTGNTLADVLTSILREDPPPLPPQVPPAMQAVIRRCLEKDPDDRFGSARDLAFALEASVGGGEEASIRSTSGLPESQLRSGGGVPPLETSVTPAPPAQTRGWIAKARKAAWPAILLVAVGLSVFLTRRYGTPGEPRFTRVSFGHELVTRARFGVEEGTVVFSSRVEGRPPRIFVRRRDQPLPVPLEIEDADLLSVSSKGEIAILLTPKIRSPFVATGRLARMPLSGGAPREVMEHVALAEWAPDGDSLALVTDSEGVARLEFPRGTTLFETSGLIPAFRFSPRGDRIAFLHQPVRGQGVAQLMITAFKEKPLALGRQFSPGGLAAIAWDPKGEHIIVGGAALRSISMTGERSAPLPLPSGASIHDVDANGRLLIDAHERRADILASTKGSAPRSLSHLSFSLATALSPDDELLAFMEAGAGGPRACIRRLSDNTIVELGAGVPTSFSPDGKFLLTLVGPGVSLLPTGVGDPRPVPGVRANEVEFGSFSPDGKQVTFVENQPDGTVRVFVQGVEGDAKQTTVFSGKAAWGGVIFDADSKGLVTGLSDKGLVVLPLDGGPARPIRGTLSGDIPIMVAASGTLYLQQLEDLPGRIYAVDMKTGVREVAVETPATDPAGVFGYGPAVISPDRRTWATTVHRHLSRLTIVER